MSTFSGYHIQQFNQKCKALVGDGKVVYSHRELRDLQSEILDLLLALRNAEQAMTEMKAQSSEITIELQGGSF